MPELRKAGEAIKKANEAFGGQAVQDEVVAKSYRGGKREKRAGKGEEQLLFRSQHGDARQQQDLIQDMLRESQRRPVKIANVRLGGQTPDEQAKAKTARDKEKSADEWAKAEKDRQEARNNARRVDELNTQGEAGDSQLAQAAKDEFKAFGRQGRQDRQLRGDISAEAKAWKAKAAAQQQRQQVGNIQDEGAMNGIRLNPQQALQILNERKQQAKQLQSLEAEAMNTVLAGQGDLAAQINMWKQFNKQAQQNRSAASNGTI